jgi:hypothetical protein
MLTLNRLLVTLNSDTCYIIMLTDAFKPIHLFFNWFLIKPFQINGIRTMHNKINDKTKTERISSQD